MPVPNVLKNTIYTLMMSLDETKRQGPHTLSKTIFHTLSKLHSTITIH